MWPESHFNISLLLNRDVRSMYGTKNGPENKVSLSLNE